MRIYGDWGEGLPPINTNHAVLKLRLAQFDSPFGSGFPKKGTN